MFKFITLGKAKTIIRLVNSQIDVKTPNTWKISGQLAGTIAYVATSKGQKRTWMVTWWHACGPFENVILPLPVILLIKKMDLIIIIKVQP